MHANCMKCQNTDVQCEYQFITSIQKTSFKQFFPLVISPINDILKDKHECKQQDINFINGEIKHVAVKEDNPVA